MDGKSVAEIRWQDGEFLHAVERLRQNGQPTPLVKEIGAQILRERGQDIRTIGGQLLHRARVSLGLITIDEAELLGAGSRLEAAGHLKLEREANLLARLDDRSSEYFVRLAADGQSLPAETVL
jgi:hypothetical protein